MSCSLAQPGSRADSQRRVRSACFGQIRGAVACRSLSTLGYLQMEIEPKSLNIPLERKERWTLVLIGACVLVAGPVWFMNPLFARAFVASCIVTLPALWLIFSAPRMAGALISKMPKIVACLFLVGYLKLAESVLVPVVLALLERAVA